MFIKKNNRLFLSSRPVLQPLETTWLSAAKTGAAMLRLDLLHPEVSGNKWFKLKYHIEDALRQKKEGLLTFGGNRSNHIAATAAICNLLGLKSIGIIRGDDDPGNPTLRRVRQLGMQLLFISRMDYRQKKNSVFLQSLQQKYPALYMVPEGGNSILGVRGAAEILRSCAAEDFTHICCPVGTGATLAGLVLAARPGQHVWGFAALKRVDEQRAAIRQWLQQQAEPGAATAAWQIFTDYHMGGFAKSTPALEAFMETFTGETAIPLDRVYTAKMLLGIKDRVLQGNFPAGSRLLIIHTGGLQGNLAPFEQ